MADYERPPRILVVEDDTDIADVLQRSLRLEGYDVRVAPDGQAALDEAWGSDPFSTTNTIEVFVSNLRRKLEAGDEPRLLHTIRGAGYVLRA